MCTGGPSRESARGGDYATGHDRSRPIPETDHDAVRDVRARSVCIIYRYAHF
jgi:hypothetical protein